MWWLLAILMFGWFWNAQTSVEGVIVQTAWTVNEVDAPGDYSAKIDLYVPFGADASVIEVAANERVRLQERPGLACTADGFEVEARFRVSSDVGADGDTVLAQLGTDTGVAVIGNGVLRVPLSLQTFIETDTPPSCAKDAGG